VEGESYFWGARERDGKGGIKEGIDPEVKEFCGDSRNHTLKEC